MARPGGGRLPGARLEWPSRPSPLLRCRVIYPARSPDHRTTEEGFHEDKGNARDAYTRGIDSSAGCRLHHSPSHPPHLAPIRIGPQSTPDTPSDPLPCALIEGLASAWVLTSYTKTPATGEYPTKVEPGISAKSKKDTHQVLRFMMMRIGCLCRREQHIPQRSDKRKPILRTGACTDS